MTASDERPRFLVWGICFGSACRELAPYWLDSLLKVGRWRHQVVLLGDRLVPSLSRPQVTALDVVPDLERRYSLPSSRWGPVTCQNWKPEIQFYVDLDRYDYLLYLDLDVLVNSDRLEALVRQKWEAGRIAVQRDIVRISADRKFTGRDVLTTEEKARWADEAICSGIVGVPTHRRGRALLRDWQAMNRAAGFRKDDQAHLLALLLRHYAGEWEYMGDTAIARVRRYQETLLHFSAQRHDLLRAYFRAALKQPEPAPTLPAEVTLPGWRRWLAALRRRDSS